MTSSTSSSELRPGIDLAPAILAALMPLLILGGAAWSLAGSGEEAKKSEAVLAIEATLDAQEPQVIALGNSLVGVGLDTDALAKDLGLPPQKVHTLWLSGTRAAHWYLLLKNRIYENDHQPKVILVVNTLQRILDTQVDGERPLARLAEHRGEHEPVLQKKTFGQETEGNLYWQRIRTRRTAVQSTLLDAAKELSVGLLFSEGPREGGLRAAGRAIADPAMERIFEAEGAVDMALHSRVIPVLERETERAIADSDFSPADSYIPDMIALARDHGAKILFVRIPVTERARPREEMSAPVQRETIALLNELGAGYVDLHEMDLPKDHYKDITHLSKKGRAAFTAALGDALVAMDVLGDGELAPAEIPFELMAPPEVERLGAPPELPPIAPERMENVCGWRARLHPMSAISDSQLNGTGLGRSTPVVLLEDGQPLRPFALPADYADACGGAFAFPKNYLVFSPTGDDPEAASGRKYTLQLDERVPLPTPRGEVYWVYPGTTLRFGFPGGEGSAGVSPGQAFSVSVGALALGGGDGPPAMILGEESVTLVEDADRVAGALQATAGADGWGLSITSPVDGPYLALSRLAIEVDGRASYLIGQPEDAEISASLLGSRKKYPPAFASAPPALPDAPEVLATKGSAARIALPELAAISENVIREHTLVKSCSPVRLSEDGAPLAKPNARCAEVREDGGGRYCHNGENLIFSSSDGSDPAENGRAYTIALDPERRCGLGWWIYPGDTMRSEPSPAQLRRLRRGGTALSIEGISLGEGDGVDLALLVDGAVWMETTLEALDGDAPAQFAIDPPLPPGALDVRVEVTSRPSSAYFVLARADVSE